MSRRLAFVQTSVSPVSPSTHARRLDRVASHTAEAACRLIALALLTSGCAEKLMLNDEQDTQAEDAQSRAERTAAARTQHEGAQEELDQTETPLPDGIPSESGSFEHRGRAGVIETVADATSETDWVQLDLDTAEQSEDDEAWDLAFSRSRIRINGGMSGPGSVGVAVLTEAFDAVESVPDDAEFSSEEPDSEGEAGDADTEPDNAFNSGGDDWYLYNVKNHTLSPRPVTYVIRSTEARYYKLRFVSYYDEHGSPGLLTLRWLALDL